MSSGSGGGGGPLSGPSEVASILQPRNRAGNCFGWTKPRPNHKSKEEKDQVVQRPREKSWKLFDEELDIVLEEAMQRPVNRRVQTLTTTVYSVAREGFGVEEAKVYGKPPKPNRRLSPVVNPRRELRQLKRRYRQSSPTGHLGLSQLRNTVHRQLQSLRKAENTRKTG